MGSLLDPALPRLVEAVASWGSVLPGTADQPAAEGQHQHTTAVLQQLGDGVHLNAHHGFESGHDQGHNDHFGELLFEGVQRIDVEQIAPEVGGILLAWIDVGDHQFVNAIAKDQQGDADQVVVNSSHHFSNQQRAVGVGEVPLHHLAQNAQFRVGANGETADTSEQAHHHGDQGDQAEFPDQGFKAMLNGTGSFGRPAHDGSFVGN